MALITLFLHKVTLYLAFMKGGGYIYIMTNKNKTTLYVGVTSDLHSRVIRLNQHYFSRKISGKYNHGICIYYEYHQNVDRALARVKQIKELRREKKEELVNTMNPAWKDLWGQIIKMTG